MGLKEDFFNELEADFREYGSESFLFRYLREEKEGRVGVGLARGEKRREAYVLLSERYRAIRGAADRTEYLKTVLRELARNEKLRPGDQTVKLLEAYGKAAGGPDAFRGCRGLGQKSARLLELLETSPEPPDADLLAAVHEDVLRQILMLDARTLLYDARRTSHKKKDRMLDLYCAYRAGRGETALPEARPVRGAALPDVFCPFFERLNRDGNDSVLLPVRIDPDCGAALCILGKRHFRCARALPKSMKGACFWICFYMNELDAEPDEITLRWTDIDESLTELCCPNLTEALAWYEYTARRKARAFFREMNGPAPEDCPEHIRSYFL